MASDKPQAANVGDEGTERFNYEQTVDGLDVFYQRGEWLKCFMVYGSVEFNLQ